MGLNEVGIQTPDIWLSLAKTGIFLALLVVALLFLKNKKQGAAKKSPAQLQVIEKIALNPRQELLVIRVGVQQLLISSGEGGVRLIAELEGEKTVARDEKQRKTCRNYTYDFGSEFIQKEREGSVLGLPKPTREEFLSQSAALLSPELQIEGSSRS